MNNLIFCELLGLPGSGKSTIYKRLKKIPKIRKDFVFFDEFIRNKIFKKFFLSILSLDFKTVKRFLLGKYNINCMFDLIKEVPILELNQIFESIITNKNNPSLSLAFDFILEFNTLFESNNINNKILIFDEGLISKMSMLESFDFKLLTGFFNKIVKYYILNLNIDPEMSYLNCVKRKRGLPKSFQDVEKKLVIQKFHTISQIRKQLFSNIEIISNEIEIIDLNIDKLDKYSITKIVNKIVQRR